MCKHKFKLFSSTQYTYRFRCVHCKTYCKIYRTDFWSGWEAAPQGWKGW